MNLGFAIAAAIGLLGAGIHVFIGGPRLARPLLRSSLHPLVITLLWACFHMVTLMVLAMSAVFAWAAVSYVGRPAAAAFTVVALAASLLVVGAGFKCKVSPLKLLPAYLFFAMAASAFWGLEGTVLPLLAT